MNMPLVLLNRRRRGGAFSPTRLFALSEPGVWYDPSDLTTLFQDTAGTTPVTTPGQTVARINDKSGRGNHATQATAASRPTYGIVPRTGRRNLLTFSEVFDNAAWSKPAGTVTITANAALAPDGTTTADLMTASVGNACHYAYQANSATGSITCTVYAKAGTASWLGISSGFTNGNETAWFDLTNGTVGTVAAGGTATITSAGNGWWRCSHTRSSWTGGGILPFVTNANGVAVFNATGTENILIWGAQLETGSTATAYQRVGSAFDVTEVGVPSLSYLSFDGVDDFLVTPTITPGIDKAQVFAGVRKLSDAAIGTLVELSTVFTNPGSFAFAVPNSVGSASVAFISTGTEISATSASGLAAPTNKVLTGLGDISGDRATLRVNGTQVDQSTADQGTGNFLAYPLYIGRRAGTSLPFNGNLYSLIVRFGANLDAATIAATEAWMNTKTGAY